MVDLLMAHDTFSPRRKLASNATEKELYSMAEAIKNCLDEIKNAAATGRLDTVMPSDASVQRSWGPAMRR